MVSVCPAISPAPAIAQTEPEVDTAESAVALRREIRVPLDHAAPDLGSAAIEIVLARPFDPELPTLLVVVDGQQFHLLREGAMERLVRDRLGEGYNAVGVIGRGFSDEVAGRVRRDDGSVDWTLAYRLLNSRQWIEDLDRVRQELVGGDGRVMLYGVSGGGFLVHEYLAVHGDRVSRALTESAPVRPLDGWLRLRHDRFWDELVADDPDGARALAAALARRGDRDDVVRLLQRQHYFVGPDELAAERGAAIEEIVAGDEKAIARRKEAYQVDAIAELAAGDTGIGIAVRMYEFVHPVLRHVELADDAVHPNVENEAALARPLLELNRRGEIPDPPFDRRALRRVDADVLLVAGRHDQTADYRAQMVLAAHYSRGELFLADDDHVLSRMDEAGARRRLVSTFLRHGLEAPATRSVIAELETLRWVER